MKPTELLHPNQRRPSKAYLVNELRKTVYSWQQQYLLQQQSDSCSSGLKKTIYWKMSLSSSGSVREKQLRL